MGIHYLVCNYCGEGFPDVIDYKGCEGCDDYKVWCSDECAKAEGFKQGTYIDEDGDEVENPDDSSCGYCRGEIEGKVEITISRHEELLEAYYKLNALECAGVDNWEGYDVAMDILDGETED
jgi:hypothetical protein